MKVLFAALTVIFAAIPGLGIIKTNLGVPPGESEILYGGIIESVCCLILALIVFNREKIGVLQFPKRKRIVISFFCFFFISLFTYLGLAFYCYKKTEQDSVFFPLWASGELSIKIEQAGSRLQLLNLTGSGNVKRIIDASSTMNLLITKFLSMILYTAVFAFLTLTFGYLWNDNIKIPQEKSEFPAS